MDFHFIQPGTSYLPELTAYEQFLSSKGHRMYMHHAPGLVPDTADVVWWICGRVNRHAAGRLASSFHIHEYASASVGRLPWLKDGIKRGMHPMPHYRIFLNDWVRQRLNFRDTTPCCLRDMGVPDNFLSIDNSHPPAAQPVDLVYLGEMSRLQHFQPTLRTIDQAGLSLLLIGAIPAALEKGLGRLENVHFTGRLKQAEVPQHLLRARAGLNLMPVIQPFTRQTATKVLEYLAVGLPVISNPYPWVQETALHHPGRIALNDRLEDPLHWQQLMADLPPRQQDRSHLCHLAWSSIIPELALWQHPRLAPWMK